MSMVVSLKNPPIIVALCQLKFSSKELIFKELLKLEHIIKQKLPLRKESLQVGINLGNSSIPIGVSKIIGTSDAKIGTYIYFSDDQKTKLEVSEDTITYIDEHQYTGWDVFRDEAVSFFSIFSELLKNVEITRISVRYINRFILPDFDSPQDYFRTQIASSNDDHQLPYPLRNYNFRLIMDLPNSNIYSILNQGVDSMAGSRYEYIFDIDVLDNQNLYFELGGIIKSLNALRDIKNNIFFSNATPKTLELCN